MKWLFPGLLIVIIGGRWMLLNSTRGLRNNNPLNIKEAPGDTTQWVGERVTDDDPVFEEFVSYEEGYRAGGRILDSYNHRGIVRMADIIRTWAPGIENNVPAYIKSVAQSSGLAPDERIDTIYKRVKLVAAMTRHEQGFNPFSDDFIRRGLLMA